MGDIIEMVFTILLFALFAFICITGSASAIKKLRGLKKGSVHRMRIMKYERIDNKLGGRFREIRHSIVVSSEDEDPAVLSLSTNSSKGARYKALGYADIHFIPGQRDVVLDEDIPHLYVDAILGLIVGVGFMLILAFIALAFIDKNIYNFGLLDKIQSYFYIKTQHIL